MLWCSGDEVVVTMVAMIVVVEMVAITGMMFYVIALLLQFCNVSGFV